MISSNASRPAKSSDEATPTEWGCSWFSLGSPPLGKLRHTTAVFPRQFSSTDAADSRRRTSSETRQRKPAWLAGTARHTEHRGGPSKRCDRSTEVVAHSHPSARHIRTFARRSQRALLTEPTVSTVQRRRGAPLRLTPSSTQRVSSPSTHPGTGHPICSPSRQLHLHSTCSLHHVPEGQTTRRGSTRRQTQWCGANKLPMRSPRDLLVPFLRCCRTHCWKQSTSCCWHVLRCSK